MADKKTKVVYELEPEINEEKVEKEMSKVDKIAKKHIKEIANGYIKLADEVANYKYPKQTVSKSGITRGTDYSKLQKAQDDLISNWKKLSKQGFSSRDEDVLNVLRSFRQYQNTAKSHYSDKPYDAENEDRQLSKIRTVIGKQINKYFTRVMGNVPIDGDKRGMFTGTKSNTLFERYAQEALQKFKAAQAAGVDLSKDEPLTAEDKAAILKYEKELLKDAMAKKVMAEREYEKKHYKQTKKAEEKALKKIEKQRAEDAKNAVQLPKGKIPEVALTSTEVEDLSKPREDTRTDEEKKADKASDRRTIKGFESGAAARKFNTPNNDIQLGYRQQTWNPAYLTKDLLYKMERGGTYVDTNSLLRQTAAYLPQALKNAMETLVVKIDKDETARVFNEFSGTEKEKWNKEASEAGMSRLLLMNVAKVQGALMAGRKDTTADTLKDAITVALADAIQHGKSEIAAENYNKAVTSITNLLMNRYSNMKDSIGSNVRRSNGEGEPDDPEIGVGRNYEEVKATLQEVFRDFQKTSEELLKVAVKQYPEYYDNKSNKPKQKEKITVFDQVFNQKLSELSNVMTNSGKTLGSLFDYSLTENASERMADTKELKASRKAIDVAKEDAADGFNAEANTAKMLGHQVSENRLSGEIKDLLIDIFSMISSAIASKSGGAGKGGGKKPPTSFIDDSLNGKGGPGSYQSILSQITQHLRNIDVNVGNILQSIIHQTGYIPTNLPATVEGQGVKSHDEPFVDRTKTDKLAIKRRKIEAEQRAKASEAEYDNWLKQKEEEEKARKKAQRKLDREAKKRASGDITNKVDMTKVVTSSPGIFGKLEDTIKKSLSPMTEAERIMNANAQEQMKMRAQRMETFGENNGKKLSDTGDKAKVKRTKQLFGWQYKGDEKNKELFQDVRLTKGFNRERTVDTSSILSEIQKVLNGPEMFKAQTGGGLRNLIGSMTGYIGMPSLEKSRAEVEGLNQVMANVRNEVQDLLQSIQAKEMTLEGMQDMGTAKFTKKGVITEDSSSAAQKTFLDLEEQKGVLKAALAEVKAIDQVVASCGGNVHKIIKNLGFVMPELMQNNTIIKNINAGLDKNGKALKFQTRTAEILNYSFQLMARHVGQMFKNWMMQLNPLTQIKKAFSDFASYDVKWQRTMNVIKYNIRRIIRPFMEWLAQQFINIIGLVNALVKGIGKAFGQNWDLFDKDAANTEKMREDFEAMRDVSAGFDELHDIGSDATTDFSGDIYTPQWTSIYETIENFGKKVGDIFKTIKDIVSGMNFWDWLILAGAALGGFLALKWLLGLFGKGKNPLQSVADGFKTLEKAVGWALLIWAFTEFTKALTDFVECMKSADWDDIAKSLIMLGGAFALLFAGIAGVQGITKLLGTTSGELFGLSALVGVFALFVEAIIPFIECIRDLGDEKVEVIASSLMTLAAAFTALIGGVAGVEGITKLIALDWQSLLGLSAVVGALDLFVAAIVPFLETVGQLGDDKWSAIGGMVTGLVGAFIALAAGVALVSKFFTAMDWKAIGQLYVVAGAFEVFMFALIPFVNAIKGIPFDTLAGGALLIAGAFIALGAAIAIMAPALSMLNWSSLAMGVILMAAMAGIIWVLAEFTKSLQGLTSEQLTAGLGLLAGAITTISLAIGILAAVFTALVTTGIGAAAIALLALVLGVVALVIVAIADLVRAIGEAGAGIKLICEGIAGVVTAIGEQLSNYVKTVGEAIAGIIEAIANGIKTVLEPIMDFMDSVMGKVVDLAKTIAHEIGETVRTVIETVGEVVLGIVDAIMGAIPNLLDSIIDFINELGPAINNFVDGFIQAVTKMVNFAVSAFEYILNIGVDVINGLISAANAVPGVNIGYASKISIPRFVPAYEVGTNYVPNDGLAYLHKGEAVIPKKYNQPYQPSTLSSEEREYMNKMIKTMESLDGTMKQGINVNGQFVQRGSDLVATVEKANNRMSNNILNNRVYAR